MIHSQRDVETWTRSYAYHDVVGLCKSFIPFHFFPSIPSIHHQHIEILGFILMLNEAIKGKHNQTEHVVSKHVEILVKFLNQLKALIAEIPPIHQPMRLLVVLLVRVVCVCVCVCVCGL